MIEGPLGGAAFNNEFGRPAINGYFRTFEAAVPAAVQVHRSRFTVLKPKIEHGEHRAHGVTIRVQNKKLFSSGLCVLRDLCVKKSGFCD